MNNIVQVRNLKLGEGMPKICVPLLGVTNEQIIQEVEYLKNVNVDLIEWRVDYYNDVDSLPKIKEILRLIRNEVKDLPILFTFRSKKEGGEKAISKEYYIQINKEIVTTGMVDLIDIELFIGDDVVKEIIDYAHNNGVKVVVSNHDFYNTPTKDEIVSRLCKMQELKADLPKIAVMPKCPKDVLDLLYATDEMRVKYGKTPIITMSMGKLGLVSRISGEVFGSAITFGSAKAASAPGQIAVKDLYNLLSFIHESKS